MKARKHGLIYYVITMCPRTIVLGRSQMMRAWPKYPDTWTAYRRWAITSLAETLDSSGPNVSQHNVMLATPRSTLIGRGRPVQGKRRAEGCIDQGTERPRPSVRGHIGRERIDIEPLKTSAPPSFERRPFLYTISLLSLFSSSLNPSFYSKTSSHKLTL